MNREPKANYTKEFREQAVKLVLVDGLSQLEAGRRLLRYPEQDAGQLGYGRHKRGKLTEIVASNRSLRLIWKRKLARVKRELAVVTMGERDVLKKATVYFAKESR